MRFGGGNSRFLMNAIAWKAFYHTHQRFGLLNYTARHCRRLFAKKGGLWQGFIARCINGAIVIMQIS